jgi:hypothetical protein
VLRLSLLALRRVLPPWLVVGLLLLLVQVARASARRPLFETDADALSGLRALARQNAWCALLVTAPLLFLRSARLATVPWARWLASTGMPHGTLGPLLGAGCAVACLLATAMTVAVSEATMAGGAEGWRRAGLALATHPTTLLSEPGSIRWSVPAPAPGTRLRLWTTVAPGSGPAVTARLLARGGGAESVCEVRVSKRTALEVEALPCPSGTLEMELERLGEGAVLVLASADLEVLERVPSERLAAWALGSRVLALLVTGCALALGLGRVLRPALAATLVCTALLSSWSSAWAVAWFPCGDLPVAWRALSEGLVPEVVPPTALAGALALSLIGLALHALVPAPLGGSAP